MFSERTRQDRTPNRLSVALERARASGRPVLDLTVSNPTLADLPYAGDEIRAALSHAGVLVYAPHPYGSPSARQAVSALLSDGGSRVDPDRVMLTASTSEAYAYLFKLLCDPGDELLVPQPSYPLFDMLAASEGVKLVQYRLAYDGEWHIPVGEVRNSLSRRARGILVVSPNNPTGSFLKRDELRELGTLGLPVISDEVFAPYAFGLDERRVSVASAELPVLTFTLGGLSKLAGLPQVKLAWMHVGGAGDEALEALARLELIADTFLSVSTPAQVALPRLLAASAVTRDAIKRRTSANMAALRHAVAPGSPLTVLGVEGGWYATVELPRTKSEEEWVLSMLERDSVYVHPGWFFDFQREAFCVLSLLTPERTFAAGVAALVERTSA